MKNKRSKFWIRLSNLNKILRKKLELFAIGLLPIYISSAIIMSKSGRAATRN